MTMKLFELNILINLAHSLTSQCPVSYSIAMHMQRKKKGKIDYLDGYYGMIKKREQVGVIEQ